MGEKYLVTGGAGFIGSHIIDGVLEKGFDVRVIDNFSTGRRENLSGVINDIELIEGDIRDSDTMNRAARGCSVILHQAALRSVPRSVDDPVSSNDVNINGTLNLLMAAKEAGVRKVVYASSSSAYGDTEALPKVETQRPLPISPYAVSKLTGEHYCRAFSRTFGIETVSLRYFNVFGPRQSPESKYAAVVPIFIKNAKEGKPFQVHGDGEQSRDFTFVRNVVNGNLLAAKTPGLHGEVFNIACDNRYSVLDVAREVLENTGASTTFEHTPPRKGDVRHTQADIGKARERLGYEVEVDFRQGIKITVESFS